MPAKSANRKPIPRRPPSRGAKSGIQLSPLCLPQDRAPLEEIRPLLEGASRIVITGHERPDGDCVGSVIALASILELQGFSVQVILDPLPDRYRYLDAQGVVRQAKAGERLAADLAIVLDATEFERLGSVNRDSFRGVPVINIDHHPSNRRFGQVNWVDASAAAAGELVWRLVSALGWRVSALALEALYVALVTDTGQFAYSNTTPRILRMAADLIEAGVDPEAAWRRIYLNKSRSELELESRARLSLEVWAGGRIASIALRHTDFKDTGTGPEVTHELVGIPRSLAGVQMALFFYELDGGRTTKVSIRSIRELSACVLAQQFGGGGHHQAAGCAIPKSLDGAKRIFRHAAEKLVRGLKAEAKRKGPGQGKK